MPTKKSKKDKAETSHRKISTQAFNKKMQKNSQEESRLQKSSTILLTYDPVHRDVDVPVAPSQHLRQWFQLLLPVFHHLLFVRIVCRFFPDRFSPRFLEVHEINSRAVAVGGQLPGDQLVSTSPLGFLLLSFGGVEVPRIPCRVRGRGWTEVQNEVGRTWLFGWSLYSLRETIEFWGRIDTHGMRKIISKVGRPNKNKTKS